MSEEGDRIELGQLAGEDGDEEDEDGDVDEDEEEDHGHPSVAVKKIRKVNKRFYRTRAHSNPLNDGFYKVLPRAPREMDWAAQFPAWRERTRDVSDAIDRNELAPYPQRQWFVDVGSGYGGLLAAMAPEYPDVWFVGLEIRERVMEFCEARLQRLRQDHPGKFDHLTYIRTNAMRFMPNFFVKQQIDKMFFCYCDPHFKKRKWRQRIISSKLLAEYAFVLKDGAVVYTVTDVKDLHEWMVRFSFSSLDDYLQVG